MNDVVMNSHTVLVITEFSRYACPELTTTNRYHVPCVGNYFTPFLGDITNIIIAISENTIREVIHCMQLENKKRIQNFSVNIFCAHFKYKFKIFTDDKSLEFITNSLYTCKVRNDFLSCNRIFF